ncbi:hypothetical protein NPIL_346811 [Nephila pilipes]|uniref:Uncharacterized protein n=1 Tax=Nephila pilipes TaxID=299642 RepID=A0A8X6U2P2_NEPPI|nr:hypothetical protein NPIL_346811 [Nephila pilipes]
MNVDVVKFELDGASSEEKPGQYPKAEHARVIGDLDFRPTCSDSVQGGELSSGAKDAVSIMYTRYAATTLKAMQPWRANSHVKSRWQSILRKTSFDPLRCFPAICLAFTCEPVLLCPCNVNILPSRGWAVIRRGRGGQWDAVSWIAMSHYLQPRGLLWYLKRVE